jgi:hypothetical protein
MRQEDLKEKEREVRDEDWTDLDLLADKYRSDKGPAGTRFSSIYDRFLSPLRSSPIRLLEIGVSRGCSISMWLEYFPNATIFGMDLCTIAKNRERQPEKNLLPPPNSPRYTHVVGDQSRREDLRKAVVANGELFDVIIDDGSHRDSDIQLTLGYLFPYLRSGGLYFIEDLGCKRQVEPGDVMPVLTEEFLTKLSGERKVASFHLEQSEAHYLLNYAYGLEFYRKHRLAVLRKSVQMLR